MSKESALSVATNQPIVPPPQEPEAVPGIQAAQEAPKELDSSRFASLAKKEAELVKSREQYKREQEQLAQEKEKLRSVQKKLNDFEELKLKDPVAALKTLGFSETDIFNYMAGAEQKPEPTLEERMTQTAEQIAEAKLKAYQEEQAKQLAEQQRVADERQIANFKQQIAQTITTKKDKLPWCDYYGPAAQDLIFATIQQILVDSQGTDFVLPEEAAEMVERYYEDEDMAKSKLRKSAEPAPIKTKEEKPKGPPSRTISNRATATVASAASVTRNETREQKKERLANWLRTGVKP